MKAMISSTALDLPAHRKCAFDACLAQQIEPIGMEYLPGSDQGGVQVSMDMVDKADIYIGIYAWRYGWVPSGSNVSITEMEFNRAVERKAGGRLREILVFVTSDAHPFRIGDIEIDDTAQKKLKEFKARATSGRISPQFSSPEELQRLISEALAHYRLRAAAIPAAVSPSTGFKPSAELATRVEDLSAELAAKALAGREDHIKELDRFLARPKGFLLVTGNAGNGKSALLAHWVKHRGAHPRIVHHMFSCRSDLTRSVLEFYRSILATLGVYWDISLVRMPSGENEARDELFALLEQVRVSGRAKEAPVLFVVDALDEAAPTGRWDSPFFPKNLPEGVHVVASVRLGDAERVPPHLVEWIAQADARLDIPKLDRRGVCEWMRQLGGNVARIADDESAINTLLQKTHGLPLHLGYIFEDLASQPAHRDDLLRVIDQMPIGFSAYVDLQFRRLVESPVGKDRRWQELFGLLIAAKAELEREDLSALLGLTPWDLHAIPPELHRWISQRDGGYAFRSEALRTAFGRLDPWPPARERLLAYAKGWGEHRRPYALRSLVPHLRDKADHAAWFAVAGDRTFLKLQGEAFPYEPMLPLQTIEDAMAEAIATGHLEFLCRLIFVHATWMPDPHMINPLEVLLSDPALARQQIRLAEATDPSTEAMWQLLVAWRCAVEGRPAEAKRFLLEIATATGRSLHVGYCAQIVGQILPPLVPIDADLCLRIARTLLDTAELPRFLAATLPAEEAIAQTAEWYKRRNHRGRIGWLTLYRELVEKGEIAVVLRATRSLPLAERSVIVTDLAFTLFRLRRLEDLHQCLVEVEMSVGPKAGMVDFMLKPRIVLLASIGALRLRGGDVGGRDVLEKAKSLVAAMPLALPHKSETMAALGVAWADAGVAAAAIEAFHEAVALTDGPDVSAGLAAGTLVDVARLLFPTCSACPAVRRNAVELLLRMEELATRATSYELENNLRRVIAEGWDEMGESDKAWEWIRRIPNPQYRGKAVAHFVSQRLKTGQLAEAEAIFSRKGVAFPGWGLVRLGTHYAALKDWNAAGSAFAKAVQSSATRGGSLSSPHAALLLAELARTFDAADEPHLAKKYATFAAQHVGKIRGPIRLWYLLNIAERTLGLKSTDLGTRMLKEATQGAFEGMNDPERIPLLCRVAKVQHLVARQPDLAVEALDRASLIIRNCIPEPVKGTIARCEIAETLHACGLDARQRLSTIYGYAERRIAIPGDRADEVIAEAALGHARVGDLERAERLLEMLGDHHFDSAARARATIKIYRNEYDNAETALAQIRNDNYRTKVRRDLACILIALQRPNEALLVARRIQVDRDNALPRIAETLVAHGFRDAFFELVTPATRYPNATSVILACILRLDPKLAPHIAELLAEFMPGFIGTTEKA